MRIGYLQLGQAITTTPKRFIKKGQMKGLLKALLVEEVAWNSSGKCTVVRELKVKAAAPSDNTRFDRPVIVVVEATRPRRKTHVAEPVGLLLQYPLADQSSYARENRRRIWSLRGSSRQSPPASPPA